MTKKGWKDLNPTEKRGIVVGGTVEVSLLLAALLDIYRRPKEQIRGNKLLWTLVSFVNFVGPLSYFLFGRRR